MKTRSKNTFKAITASAAMMISVAPFAGTANGAVIVNSGLDGVTEGNFRKGVAWTMGSTAYTFDSVEIRLRTGATLPDMTQVSFAIHANDTDSSPIGAQLLLLNDPSLTTASTTGNYTLTAGTPLTLLANTTYWFVANAPNSEDANIRWMYTGGTATTSGGVTIPTAPRYFGSNTDPTSWTDTSSVYNDLQVNATVVPEPSTFALFGLAGLGMLMKRRR